MSVTRIGVFKTEEGYEQRRQKSKGYEDFPRSYGLTFPCLLYRLADNHGLTLGFVTITADDIKELLSIELLGYKAEQ